jgi:type II secretory pathway pseudopilin PulG
MTPPLSRRHRRGFTFIEILTVFVLFACVTAIGVRSIGETLQHDRPSKAANLFAADIEMAYSMAARQRAPVRLHFDSVKRLYEFDDRTDTTVKYKVRTLSSGDREVGFMKFTPTDFYIMPSGLATSTLSAKFGFVGASGTITYTVDVSRTGLVKINGK